jgi:hypothetical protein
MIRKTSFGEYKIGGIYKHYKGNYYQILNIAFLHDSQNIYLIIYQQVDINGVYQSIRDEKGEVKVQQPFATHETRWQDEVKNNQGEIVKRFKLIK